jgi:hypothetical protein
VWPNHSQDADRPERKAIATFGLSRLGDYESDAAAFLLTKPSVLGQRLGTSGC